MALKALFLNCTLKKSPETSNTEAYISNAKKIFRELEVETESVRVVDYNLSFGNTSDEGDGDEWPKILQKVKESDIVIIATPIWRGDRSAVAKVVAERFDGIWNEADEETGQYPTFNKVAGVMVDGNEDGAKKAISSICFDLSEHGFSLPVNAFSYYVGKAGPGPAYIEANGDKHFFTNRTLYLMVYNLVHLANTLKENPYPTNVNELAEKAKKISYTEE
ncbi:8-demethyl-8-aminoriboflavin-5'-phosphate (AFP) synthase RosB [Salinimicrobium marinum]|uniref:8-demethyl-8-aminoriboflavin-5'-phosphate (AFP) synthase RosB n=1 Tax=Salinimicrobium marinum TaxID=680283 RepID=A0A918SDC8_9FLAO|nr:flavodoxin family protein [Salinimicrobium marinum]GHA33248.1 8-demethyl-8-aminoriboflavin-5'-phosphate (AFP) synthase RosB [Salinimicrobium marinum]